MMLKVSVNPTTLLLRCITRELVRNAESQVPTHPNRTPGGFMCAVKFGKCCSEGLFSTIRAVIRAPRRM